MARAVPEIAARFPETCIVILPRDESRQVVLELLAAGAIAYLRKRTRATTIISTLSDALRASAGQLRR